MKRGFLSLIIIQILLARSINGYSQPRLLDQKVTLSFEGISLEKLFDHLASAYQINLSYSADNVPLGKTVSIKAFNLPLRSFIKRLCRKAGLTYRIIDGHIVLREKKPTEKPPINPVDGRTEYNNPAQAIDSLHPRPVGNIRPINTEDIMDGEPLPEDLGDIGTIPRPMAGPAFDTPYRKRANFAIGLLVSYDHFKFDFKERPNTDQKYCPGKNFSTGAFGTIWPGQRIFASIGLLFSTKSYYLDYNYKMTDPDDPFPFPEKTTVYLSYAEFPVSFGYRFFKAGNFSLYLSAGLITGFLIHKAENTGFLNGEEKATAYFIEDNNKFLWGGSLGMKLGYDLGKTVCIFFKPSYVFYFVPLNDRIMSPNPRILKLKTGISLKIKAIEQL